MLVILQDKNRVVVIMQWCTTSTAVTCCTPWGGSLGYVNHPGNLYPLKWAVWTGGSFKEGVRGRGRILSLIGIVSGSSVAGILGQWFSTFVRPRPDKSFLYKTRARYRLAARRLRNTVLGSKLVTPGVNKRRRQRSPPVLQVYFLES
jgi:hypothetical protein